MITKKGKELAELLAKSWGQVDRGSTAWCEILILCSRICRQATTYKRIQEEACNRELTAWETRKDKLLEAFFTTMCEKLPYVRDTGIGAKKPITPMFQGDPRGCTVILRMPDGRYDDWGQRGICVPGA